MMGSFGGTAFSSTWLSLLAFAGSSAAAEPHTPETNITAVGAPPGFAELTHPREALVDLYFGGRKIGETRISARPGFVRFRNPNEVLPLLSTVIPSNELARALAAELPSNTNRVCPEGMSQGCGVLFPELVGVIFDENRFRLDLFVNSESLQLSNADEARYLSTPTAPLSLTSATGLALSGSSATSPVYNLQNRSIVAFRNARIRSDSSYASNFGLVIDNLVAEIDRPNLRYSAGLFWAPGVDLTGQRRILGVGLGTQFDTRVARDQIQGTPLIVFLAQPSRVEVLIDGRLVNSAIYEAGNNVIDTSSLPNGSYSVLLRIQEMSGEVREERRFFVKNAQIAPVGEPLYFAYVGMLANTRPGRPVSLSKDLFYQFGTARRVSDSLALDLSLIGTTKKPLIETGAWLITRVGRLRAAAIASTSGDHGALLQLASAQADRLAVNFDLRRIWSRNNRPLIPVSTHVETFRSGSLPDHDMGEGTYTQISGSAGYRFGAAYLTVIGSYRKDEGRRSDYSIGPSLSWSLANRNGMQVALQADAQVTRTTTAGYLGFRMHFYSGAMSVLSSGGQRVISDRAREGSHYSRAIGGVSAQYAFHKKNLTEVSVGGGLNRDLESTTGHATGTLYSRFGSARGGILQNFEGDKGTQYTLAVQNGLLLNRASVAFGGRNLEESALVVSIAGRSDAEFEVLIDDQPRGRLRSGARLPIFLQPYRAYKVRLRPVNSASVWYESSAREFTLYPGNMQIAQWRVEQVFTVFGRAIRSDGSPVADAVVKSKRGLGQSDSNGYFQIEVTANESVSFNGMQGRPCTVNVGSTEPRDDYAALGKVICQ